jgi:hypothetical protein
MAKLTQRIAALILLAFGVTLFFFAKNDWQFFAVGILVGFTGRAVLHPAQA